MKHIDLFSGIGGFALAATWVWGDEYENVGHSEIESYPCKVYHRHFPESECLGDITKIDWTRFAGTIDLVTGGFPCQDISVAGPRTGITGERSGLWREIVRAIRMVRPKVTVVENVAALLERGMGTVLGDLAGIGNDAEWDCLSAEEVGAHFVGDRVWITTASPASSCSRLQGDWSRSNRTWSKQQFEGLLWSETQLSIPAGKNGRISDGISNRMGPVKALGNAIVPQCAAVIMEKIKDASE